MDKEKTTDILYWIVLSLITIAFFGRIIISLIWKI